MKNVGDMDDDGVNDLLVGASSYGGGSFTTGLYGVAYLISGTGI